MKRFNWILYFISVPLFLFSCGDDNGGQIEIPGDDTLVKLSTDKSFSLLTINANHGLSSGNYAIQGLKQLVLDYNPDVITMQEVDFNYRSRDLVTEIAYHSATNGQPRQGSFTPVAKTAGKEEGLGLFVKGLFNGTERIALSDGLVLYTMEYSLPSGRTVTVATCNFENSEKALAQARALASYAEKVKTNFVVTATIYAEPGSDVMDAIEKAYRRSCKFNQEKTYPAAAPANRYTYILTPLSQTDWGTEIVTVVGNESVSGHKGLLIRIGFRK